MVNEKKSDRRLFVRTPLVVLLCVALIFALAPSIPHAGGAASAVGLTQDEWAAAEATNPNPKADEPTTSARTRVTEKATGLFEALGVSGT
ncbi:MAG: hypothetical protein LBL54_01270, partial [Clostridiales Family XIII bacterium]|nr:hypothetical protein [Clostridiales Family XIII bacterium]